MDEAEEFALQLQDLHDIEEFVRAPTWRELLLESIEKESMDPWNIDIIKIADAYLSKVREMRSLDLRVPANVMLASALLLHYKAHALKLFVSEPAEPEPETVRTLLSEEIPDLAYNPENARTRSVTLEELLTAVEEVMASGRRELPVRVQAEPLRVELSKEDMHETMRKVYEAAGELKDEKNILLFSELMRQFNGHGESRAQLVSYSLLPVLHLVQDDKLNAWQDSLFGEIFIKVL